MNDCGKMCVLLMMLNVVACDAPTTFSSATSTGTPPVDGPADVWTPHPRTDLAGLQALIKLPRVPKSVAWEVDDTSREPPVLMALLLFSSEDEAYLLQHSPTVAVARAARAPRTVVQHWMPPEVRKQLESQVADQEYRFPGRPIKKPDLFFGSTSLYSKGFADFIGMGYVVLHVSVL